ncbi:unnamed protein product [Caenorhabditis brenneri]
MGDDNDEKSTQSPSFSNLPMEIHSQILKELDPIHRLIVRKVSRRLRLIVDNDSPQVNSIKLTGKDDGSCLSIAFDDKTSLDFIPKDGGCQIDFEKRSMTVPGVAHHEMALNFLKPLFLNPKLRLQNLTMWCDFDMNYLIDSLTEIVTNSSNTPFHVKNLAITLRKPVELTSIIAFFKPGVLETLDIQGCEKYQPKLMDFMETPHFKQAKVVTSSRCEPLNSPAMIERFLHLKAFEVRILYVSFEDLRWLRKIISRSPTVKQCKIYLYFHLTMELIHKAFPGGDLERTSIACYYDYHIPNSQEILSFTIRANLIEVERKLQE